MVPVLPQHDEHRGRRAEALARARDRYAYDYGYLPGVAMAREVPREDRASLVWWAEVGATYLRILLNTAKVLEQAGLHELEATLRREKLAAVLAGEHDHLGSILDDVQRLVLAGRTHATATSLAPFEALFEEWPTPSIARSFEEDATFARMRVAGPNPMQIRRLDRLPETFPVTETHFRRALGEGDSLAAALAEGRAFLADYSGLDGLLTGTFPHGRQKYLAAPLALFVVPRGGDGSLRPIAIRCTAKPADTSPVFTPADGLAWRLARSAVQTADGNVHQAVTHLAHTHLVLEAFVVAAHRQLHATHPLFVLLAPHFEGTLHINFAAHESLLAPGGGVDTVLAGTIETSRAVAANGVTSYRFDEAMFPNALRASGVDDASVLRDHPYRDDGALLWDAIHRWVGSYVRTYYTSDADVVGDPELQAFWDEVTDPENGGRIAGASPMRGVAYLTDAIAHVIFTASARHAAVNFPQVDLMAFVPNQPLSMFTPAPARTTGFTESDYFAMLPPLDVAHVQNSLGFLLGSVHHTRLGHYGGLVRSHFHDDRVHAAQRAFVAELERIESIIEDRNTTRVPYAYLLPSKVPQSINI